MYVASLTSVTLSLLDSLHREPLFLQNSTLPPTNVERAFDHEHALTFIPLVGGLLAAGLLSVGHIGSRSSWQNIFLVGE